MSVRVLIIESEKDWGTKVVDIKYFDTREEAQSFCKDYNKDNNQPVVPDWYMAAIIDGEWFPAVYDRSLSV